MDLYKKRFREGSDRRPLCARPLRFVVVAALALAASSIEPTWAQQQRVEMTWHPVESGRIDTPSIPSTDGVSEEHEMCLREGLYVLVFARHSGRYSGLAFVGTGPGRAPIAMDMAARIVVSRSHQDGWAWDSFEVDDDTCFRFFVSFGSARVYQLRVGIDW